MPLVYESPGTRPCVVDPPLVLAPMAGITDGTYRLLLRRMGGVGLVTMEFVSSEGLTRGARRTERLLRWVPEERPLSIQIYGSDAARMAEAARRVEDEGVDVCDINMGCPANKILKGCAGAGLMRDLTRAQGIISACRKALPTTPLTVKFRAGITEETLNFVELGRICEGEGVAAVALHPRTAKQFYTGRADWSRIARLKEAVRIPVVGNGDVETPEDVPRMLRETGCDAVMIGRATMKNPWIFRQAADLLAGRPYRVATLEERRDVILQHFRLIREAEEDVPKRMMGKLKTFTGWYTHGVPKGTELRRRIQSLPTPEAFLAAVESFFALRIDERDGRASAPEVPETPASARFLRKTSREVHFVRRVVSSLLVLLAASLATSAAGQPVQKTSGEAAGVSIPLELREQFLGTSAGKTVVRFTLTFSRADLREKANLAPRAYAFFVAGEAKDGTGAVVDSFREPVDVDLGDGSVGKPLTASFLRSLPPGEIDLNLRLEAETGKAMALRAVTLTVPKMTSEFRAEDAGPLSASAILLEEANRDAPPPGGTDLLRFLPPSREVPVGLLRIECEVKPPIVRVEFHLGDKLILVRNRPPYTVEIDLGTIPRKQTLRALGFDRLGNFVDADAWALNEKEAKLAVRVLDLPKAKGKADAEVKVAVQSIAGATARKVELFLDDRKVAEWTAPPYRTSVPAADVAKATLMRASAWDAEGKEYSDFRMLKGDSRFLANVEVNLVELNVSVFDEAGRFAKGLAKEDFTVLEDGAPQTLSAFEFAESLPMALGLVIDGSGSMDKSMPLVKQAATEFVTNLVGEKEKGFVIEFRERPTLLAAMTSRRSDLIRAIGETRAGGATAFHDSIVLGLYQFRSLAGKKALVVLTDGKDNHSSTDWPTLKRYVRTAGVPIFIIGLDLSMFDMGLKSRLKELAEDTGGEAFFVGGAKELPAIYKKIETEVRSQYFLSYLTESKKKDDEFRLVEVRLGKPGLKAKTIRGYFP